MALLNIFKRKKREEKEKTQVIEEKKQGGVVQQRIQSSKKTGLAPFVLISPHITEKATDMTEHNQYTFKVFKKVNKSQIKKAVEEVYNVEVLAVHIINTKPKKRRVGRFEGKRPGYKKAVVKLKEGQKIELIPR